MHKNIKNLTGKIFGYLTVLSICEEKYIKGKCLWWNCLCVCGKEIVVSGRELRANDSTSCGCQRKIDMTTGSRYGSLVVIRCDGKNSHGSYMWLCQCDCGNTKSIKGDNLRNGTTKSCGCETINMMVAKIKKLPGEASFNGLYGLYKRQAKSRNIEFKLEKDYFKELTKGKCHYCGVVPLQEYKNRNNNGSYIYNGVDRVDPQRGYVLDNVVSCCGQCNYAKRSMTVEQFFEWNKRVFMMFKEKMEGDQWQK